jgi:Xaa-Pro aminopeptidase
MFGLPPQDELRKRLSDLREIIARERLSGFLVTDPANVRYLSGFTGDDSALLITPRHRLLLTDFRYTEEAQSTAPGWSVRLRPAELLTKAGHFARKLRVRRLGFESECLTVGQLRSLRKTSGPARLKPTAGLVAHLRQCKSPWEIRQIERALRIQEAAFRRVCRMLRPGMQECEAAAEMRYALVKGGAQDEAFASMCQWGSNSSWPHGRPTLRRLREDDVILMDWGAKVAGYHSDLTRTFCIGKMRRCLREIHEVVAEAQARAKARVGPGVPFAEVDKAARSVIRKAGYGKYFGHSTGHGLGLNIHEAPRLSSRAQGELQSGMVVTVEPGIYLPGIGGVRLEDDVLVTGNGHRVLSCLPIGLQRSR